MAAYDYLVVGQGIAGTCMAITLLSKGQNLLIADSLHPNSSSRVAAGFMHPITGRRLVKSWMADQFFPFAFEYYRQLEELTGKKFLHRLDTVEIATDPGMVNEWQSRSREETMMNYISSCQAEDYAGKICDFKAAFNVKNSGWLDLPVFLDTFRSRWQKENRFVEAVVEPGEITLNENGAGWNGHSFKRVIFCEGFAATSQPLWNWLPFDAAKGEILTLEIPGLPEDAILVHGLFYIPLGNSTFRVGSTYSWHELDDIPTGKGKEELLKKVSATIRLPFKTTGHRAGVRPAVKGRRPLLGRHPHHTPFWIFNGLGSKGSTLAPWLSGHLADHMEQGSPLLSDVDINRFII